MVQRSQIDAVYEHFRRRLIADLTVAHDDSTLDTFQFWNSYNRRIEEAIIAPLLQNVRLERSPLSPSIQIRISGLVLRG